LCNPKSPHPELVEGQEAAMQAYFSSQAIALPIPGVALATILLPTKKLSRRAMI
jgi:hypothetical protein